MKTENRLVVAGVKEEVEMGGKWVRLQKSHMREPCGDRLVLHLEK